MTTHELLLEFASVVSHGRARGLMDRARRLAGLGRSGRAESLEQIELLMILESIAAEGGELQMLAEGLSRRALAEAAERRPERAVPPADVRGRPDASLTPAVRATPPRQ